MGWLTDNPLTQFTKQLNVPGMIGDLASNIGAGVSDVKAAGRGVAQLDPSANKPPAGQGGQSGGSTSTGTSTVDPNTAAETSTVPTTTSGGAYQPLVNPLAWNALFAQNIAPLMGQIGKQFADQSTQWQNAAKQNLQQFQMPAQFKAMFGQQLPQMAQDAAAVNATLMNAAMAAPAFDQTMSTIGGIQNKIAQLYAEQQYNRQQGINQAFGAPGAGLPTPPGAPTG